MDKKICNVCNKEKPEEDFYQNRKRCKKCFQDYAKNNPNQKNNRKKYYQKNKDKLSKKSYHYYKNVYNKNEPKNKLVKLLRSRYCGSIKQSFTKSFCVELLGCSLQEALQHIESKFKDGMTWENHGSKGWHLDHIKPCCSFNLVLEEDLKKCFHYTNLQPLWWRENLSKAGECADETPC